MARALIVLLSLLLLLGSARGQAATGDCEPSWLPTFGEIPGVDDTVFASVVFDDGLGGGPALYAGGDFLVAGGESMHGIARFDGTDWSPVGDGFDGVVFALIVHDDGAGDGPALYAGGSFTSADGLPARCVARWDGASWTQVGAGLGDGVAPDSIHSFAIHDDGGGDGPALYAGGAFELTGGPPSANVLRWDGSSWSPVGLAFDRSVQALGVYDAPGGAGPRLYAGGFFNNIGGVPANKIAEWNGSSWTSIGSLMTGIGHVSSLAVFDGGGGDQLFVGGRFDTAGGLTCNGIATWNGSTWASVGGGMTHESQFNKPDVDDLLVVDLDGGGPALYAAGDFMTAGGVTVNDVARWNGSSWSALGSGVAGASFSHTDSLAAFDSGDGLELYVGGYFGEAGGVSAIGLARWNGASWSQAVPSASGRLNGSVNAVVVFDDGLGGGPALYASGGFWLAGAVPVNHVAKWDGAQWSPLGSGLSDPALQLVVFDDGRGGGPALYAAGSFDDAGGVPGTSAIARWDGTVWSSVGPPLAGLYSSITTIEVHDDGSGPALYIAGNSLTDADFTLWDGITLSSFDDGESDGQDSADFVFFDDGSGGGPALYACGSWYEVGGDYQKIARWDGSGWSTVGGGLEGFISFTVSSLAVFDDGNGDGPALYAAGSFSFAGGGSLPYIARWDGTSWSDVGDGTDEPVGRLAVFDDGSGGGPALYAIGFFTLAGHAEVQNIAKWDGSQWSALGGGLSSGASTLAVLDLGDEQGASLYVGGGFGSAIDSGDGFLARWGGCPTTPSPWTHLGYALAGVDGPPLLAGTGSLTAGSAGTLKLTHAAPTAFSVLFISLAGSGAAFKCGTLVPVPITLQFPLFTNASGALPLAWASWPAGLSGLSLYLQYGLQDAAASCGVALSNALRADAP